MKTLSMKSCVRQAVDTLHLAFVFLTRLPLPRLREPVAPVGRALWAAPVVGLTVGAGMAAVWAGTQALGLSGAVAAGLALGAGLLLTGGLHEDGLADVADGFWGSHRRERRLEILRDSRLGTYGALVLVMVLGLRWAALSGASLPVGGLALLVAPALGRATLPLTLALLPPARADGLGAGAGRMPGWGVIVAWVLAGGLAAALAGAAGVQAATLAALLVLGWCWLAWRKIGGQTGDVLGAGAALAETLCLIWLTA